MSYRIGIINNDLEQRLTNIVNFNDLSLKVYLLEWVYIENDDLYLFPDFDFSYTEDEKYIYYLKNDKQTDGTIITNFYLGYKE